MIGPMSCNKFHSSVGSYQKLEEQRIAKEHEFRIKQLNMEKEMRKEEREHKLNMLRLLMVPQAPSSMPIPSSRLLAHLVCLCLAFCFLQVVK